MAFRRRRDAWDDFLRLHGPALRWCGIPDFVVSSRKRFFIFLDHGYDEWGAVEHRDGYFDARSLTDEQVRGLADLLGRHVDERWRAVVESRWTRLFGVEVP